MNKCYFIFLWMRWKWATIAVLAGNVGAILAAVFGYWTDWLFMLPGLALILWKGAYAHMGWASFEWSCRFGNHAAHYATTYGKPIEGHMQAAQVFIRRYPWASRNVDYKMVPVMGNQYPTSSLFLKFSGRGIEWQLDAANAAKELTGTELSQLMRMCK